MRDEADAGGEEARVGFRAVDRLGEFGREGAEHGRGVDPDLLEHAALHHPHRAATAGRARRIGAFPVGPLEAPGGKRAAAFVLERLEGGTQLVAERAEPRLGGKLFGVESGEHVHRAFLAKRHTARKRV